MKYRRLGKSDLFVSKIILGCAGFGDPNSGYQPWVIPEAQAKPIIIKALELGINTFDTSNMYSYGESEAILGRAIEDYGSRDRLVIATKVFFSTRGIAGSGGLSRKSIIHEVEQSLRRLRTDYIDLYQIHRWDEQVRIEETLEVLDLLVKSGKVRYIGASSMFAWQFSKALHTSEANGWAKFVSMQPHYNLIYREEEREMIPLCKDQNIGVIPWSPLARGRLMRKLSDPPSYRYETDQYGRTLYSGTELADQAIVERVFALSSMLGVKPVQVALSWHLSKEYITAPIVGVDVPEQLLDLVGALDINLSVDNVSFLEALYFPHNVAGCQVIER
jgi:aryl-alcohol dehydrogenase-like predicted oxidoreductase